MNCFVSLFNNDFVYCLKTEFFVFFKNPNLFISYESQLKSDFGLSIKRENLTFDMAFRSDALAPSEVSDDLLKLTTCWFSRRQLYMMLYRWRPIKYIKLKVFHENVGCKFQTYEALTTKVGKNYLTNSITLYLLLEIFTNFMSVFMKRVSWKGTVQLQNNFVFIGS